MDLSGDESDWCEVSVCVCLLLFLLSVILSRLCGVVVSDSDCESVQPQTVSLSRKRDARV